LPGASLLALGVGLLSLADNVFDQRDKSFQSIIGFGKLLVGALLRFSEGLQASCS
jgi:hypothetical protein